MFRFKWKTCVSKIGLISQNEYNFVSVCNISRSWADPVRLPRVYKVTNTSPPPPPPTLGSAVLGVMRHIFSCVGATFVRYTYKLFGLGADFFILWLSSVASKFWCENQFS